MNKSYEMSRIIHVNELNEKLEHLHWVASEEEKKALASRLKVLDIQNIEVSLSLQKKELIKISGNIKASLHQLCVVTNQPVLEHIDEDFEEFFCEQSIQVNNLDIDMDVPDIEPVQNGCIDVGELATEYLIMSLNPYPRAKGVKTVEIIDKKEDDENPFSVLKNLK